MTKILTSDNTLLTKDDFFNFQFSSLNEKEAQKLFEYLLKNNIEESIIESILIHLNRKSQQTVIKNFTFKVDIIKQILINGYVDNCEYLLQNDSRIVSFKDFKETELLKLFTNTTIPPHLLEEKSFLNKITTMTDIQMYRFLIQALEPNNDVSFIEEKRKVYYDKTLNSYDEEKQMLKKYSDCYEAILNDENPLKHLTKILTTYLDLETDSKEYYYFFKPIYQWIRQSNASEIKKFLKEESNLEISNIIIDYHFEDIYYNVLLDLKQLVRFQQTEGKTLDEETLNEYETILNIDNLSYMDKMKLHDKLKQRRQTETLYDEFRKAKDKAYELIGKSILTKDKLETYKDIKLSQELSVPIYILKGEPFFAFVKSLNISKNTQLKNEDNLFNIGDGASYSLDAYNKLNTFRSPEEYYNIVYDNIPSKQIVHLYPVDSCSNYSRDESSNGTNRVFQLLTPLELTGKSNDYNEIVVAQRNKNRKDELNSNMKMPRPIAIYCYNNFTENDIESAKRLGLGIVVVKTNCYPEALEPKDFNFGDTFLGNEGYIQEINYLTNINQEGRSGRKKK